MSLSFIAVWRADWAEGYGWLLGLPSTFLSVTCQEPNRCWSLRVPTTILPALIIRHFFFFLYDIVVHMYGMFQHLKVQDTRCQWRNKSKTKEWTLKNYLRPLRNTNHKLENLQFWQFAEFYNSILLCSCARCRFSSFILVVSCIIYWSCNEIYLNVWNQFLNFYLNSSSLLLLFKIFNST